MCFYLDILTTLQSNRIARHVAISLMSLEVEIIINVSRLKMLKRCVKMMTSRWRFRAISRPVVTITFFTGSRDDALLSRYLVGEGRWGGTYMPWYAWDWWNVVYIMRNRSIKFLKLEWVLMKHYAPKIWLTLKTTCKWQFFVHLLTRLLSQPFIARKHSGKIEYIMASMLIVLLDVW